MTRPHLSLLVGFTVSAVLAGAALRAGQTTSGVIEGRVTNATGGVLAGATVTVVNTRTRSARITATDQQGHYRAENLSPGTYEIRAERSGFRTGVRGAIALAAGRTLDISLSLEVDPGCTSTDLYSRVQTSADILNTPHAVFCGNQTKGVRGENCSTASVNASGSHLPALERVEVRGWIRDIEAPDTGHQPPAHRGYHDDGPNRSGVYEEYNFRLQLDLNWDPSPCLPSGVTPINSLTNLARAITPYSDVATVFSSGSHWATGTNGQWDATTQDRPASGAIMKVEINGWRNGGRVTGAAPEGWVSGTGSDPGVLWPFDPERPLGESQFTEPLTDGNYVRLVGTLWEDAHHDTGGASSCWSTGSTSERGWPEIHPVDYMARITRIGRSRPSTYAYLALCDNASVTSWVIPAPGPPPVPRATVRSTSIVSGDFTTHAHVSPPLTVRSIATGVSVSVGVRNWSSGILGLASHTGRWLGFFEVYWGPPPTPPSRAHNECLAQCHERYDLCVESIESEPGGPTRSRCGQLDGDCRRRCPP